MISRSLARRFFSRAGAMLVSAYNRSIDHHVFVVMIACQHLKNALEHPALRPTIEALIDDFPIAKTLREIAPRNAGSISEQNGFDEQPIIRRRAPNMAFAAG